MEHVNNDMDELFRKAGELYPLKTTESDWDSVLGKLQDEISGESGSFSDLQTNGNGKKRRWLLLTLLIPFGLLGVVYFSNPVITKKAGLSSGAAKGNQSPNNSQNENSEKSVPAPPQATANRKMADPVGVEVKADQLKPSVSDGNSIAEVTVPGVLNAKASLNGSGDNDKAGSEAREKAFSAGFAATANSSYSSRNDDISNASGQKLFHEPAEKFILLSVINSNENPAVYGIPFPPLNKTGVTLNTNAGNAQSKPKSANQISSKGIYAALIGGPDLSRVANQSTSQTGYSLGILIGYQFNKRIAIETGLLWDKKYYYSDGQHFDKNAAQFPPNWNVLYLNGNCDMFEIPLNFRYNFATGINHGFFAEAGFSSYLMKKEYYDYSYTSYNSPPKSKDSTYHKSSNYIFSVIQISAGYEHTIGKNTSIRIEPYLKIPIQGIGIGNMPVTSAGLYIGISHNFR